MIGLAVVLALGGTGAVYAYVKHADQRAVADSTATTVVVATKRVPAGTTWKAATAGGYLRTENLPASSAPSDALDHVGDQFAQGDVVFADIQPGQVVLREMFGVKTPTTSGLAIPNGKMAVSVKLKTNEDVAGYVQPGSQIAVFDTFILGDKNTATSGSAGSVDKKDNWATKLLLPRVDVLAVSQAAPSGTQKSLDSSSSGSSSDTTLLVTVAVSQADAERLIEVAQVSNPYLALLSDSSKSGPAPGVDGQGKLGSVFPDWK